MMLVQCFLLVLVLCFLVEVSNSQETNSFLSPSYTFGVNHKSNFCPLHRLTETGEVGIKDILRGKNISVGLFRYQLEDINGTYRINEARPGAGIRFLDELAEEAGFTWRDSFGLLDSPQKELNQTWSGLLRWAVDSYDVVGDWYLETLERLGEHIVFPVGWYDGSLIMVRKKPVETYNKNFWAFISPFSPGVWYTLIALTVFSGLVLYLLDYINSGCDQNQVELSLVENVYTSFMGFTGHIIYTPGNSSAQIMIFSISFLFLLVVSAYTANLASFLVIQNQPALIITDIADAMKADFSFCVLSSSTSHTYMKDTFTAARIVERDTIAETYLSVVNGECDVVLTTKGTWEKNELNPELNVDCSLEWVGRVVQSFSAGFSLRDSAEYCSSLLRDVLSYHMVEMKLKKKDVSIRNKVLRTERTYNCAAQEAAESNDLSSTKMNLYNLGGVFAVHLIATSLAVALSLYAFFKEKPYVPSPSDANKHPRTDGLAHPPNNTDTQNHSSASLPIFTSIVPSSSGLVAGSSGTSAVVNSSKEDKQSKRISKKDDDPVDNSTNTAEENDLKHLVNKDNRPTPNSIPGAIAPADVDSKDSMNKKTTVSFIAKSSVLLKSLHSPLASHKKSEEEEKKEDIYVMVIMVIAILLLWGSFWLLLAI